MPDEETTPAETTILGVIDFGEAKRLKFALEERGVQVLLRNNPETCASGGCKPTVEVIARNEDMPKIQEFFQHERNRSYEGLEFDPETAGQVFDSEKDHAVCPACGTQFSTQLKECPDCGLGFAVE